MEGNTRARSCASGAAQNQGWSRAAYSLAQDLWGCPEPGMEQSCLQLGTRPLGLPRTRDGAELPTAWHKTSGAAQNQGWSRAAYSLAQDLWGPRQGQRHGFTPACPPAQNGVTDHRSQGKDLGLYFQKALNSPRPALNSSRPALNSSRPALNSPRPALNSPRPALNSPRPALNSQLSTPTSQLSTPSSQISMPSSQLSTPSSQLSTPSSQLSTPSSQLSTPSSQLSMPSSQLSTPSFQLSTPSSQLSTPSPQLSTPSSQLNSQRTF
uniref:putative protein TPRXL n=1 Tax=Oncorhynchus gorbuscha TaxID=8017 RepID=UPI001EAEE3E4|nr:putative protein TPRXL [Oncorhynchus gorbuscha]